MGEIHFHRKDAGPNGLTRDRYTGGHRLLEDLAFLSEVQTRKRNRIDPPWLRTLLIDLQHAALGEALTSDGYLLDQLSWTNWDRWLERVQASNRLRNPHHRIAVRSSLTTPGNLTVRFAPQYLDDAGNWQHAPEWQEMRYLGMAAIAERPDDEILFLHGVDRLVISQRQPEAIYVEPEILAPLSRVINAVFWRTLDRYARSLEIYVQSYVALLHTGAKERVWDEPDVVGIEVVDADADLRSDTSEDVDAFERDAGCSIPVFLATWQEAEAAGRRPADYVSRRLRVKNGPTSGLTPGAADSLHRRLEKAQKMRLWHPPPIKLPEIVREDRPNSPPVATPRPAPKVVAFPGVKRSRSAHADGLPHIELSEEDQARFRVLTAAELVEAVNAAFASAGRRPLTQGDMPTNRSGLKRLLNLAKGVIPEA